MGRVPHVLAILACLLLTSCASLNPRNWNKPTANSKPAKSEGTDRIPPPDPPDAAAAVAQRRNPAPKGSTNGILAGEVIDGLEQKRPGAIILVRATDAGPNDAPLEAMANDQGYFVIQGLQPGRRYKLAARFKQGDQDLAGTTIATPPNAVVVIKMGEDFATAETPSLRPGKSPPDPKAQAKAGQEGGWSPNASQNYLNEADRGGSSDRLAPTNVGAGQSNDESRSARLGAPERNGTPKPPAPTAPFRKELIGTEPGGLNSMPPPAGIPPQSGKPGDTNWTPAHGGAAPMGARDAPAAGSFCTLSGDKQLDFALPDLNGRPFQLSEVRGKVVLLDFWGTWCPACVQGMPHLIELQRRYGQRGLEVVGIAYERDGTPSQRVDRVNFVRTRQGVNYKVLVGDGSDCPVLKKLDVQAFPTLVLVDTNGQIVWRGEGLSAQNKARLEAELRRRLPGE